MLKLGYRPRHCACGGDGSTRPIPGSTAGASLQLAVPITRGRPDAPLSPTTSEELPRHAKTCYM